MMRAVLALGGALLLGACVMPHHHHHHHGWSALAGEEADDDEAAPATSGDPDVDFLRAMIAHHEEGTAMAAEAARDTRNPRIRDLARRLERQGRRDAARMEALERRLAP